VDAARNVYIDICVIDIVRSCVAFVGFKRASKSNDVSCGIRFVIIMLRQPSNRSESNESSFYTVYTYTRRCDFVCVVCVYSIDVVNGRVRARVRSSSKKVGLVVVVVVVERWMG
jgi:hypothetical protein